MLNCGPPKDLCPKCRTSWLKWRDHFYDWRNPTEWPGGSHIMDSRTSHEDRENDWDRKNREQMNLIENICRQVHRTELGNVA